MVALNALGFVHLSRVETFEPEIAFGSSHKKRRSLMHPIKASKIQIPSVDDIEGSRFEDHLIEDPEIVNFAMGDNDEGGNTSSGVEQGMQFHCAFVSSELGSRKKRHAQIDGGRVQGIDGLIQFDTEGIVGVEAARLADETLCKVGVDSPISDLVGMSQGIA